MIDLSKMVDASQGWDDALDLVESRLGETLREKCPNEGMLAGCSCPACDFVVDFLHRLKRGY